MCGGAGARLAWVLMEECFARLTSARVQERRDVLSVRCPLLAGAGALSLLPFPPAAKGGGT